MPTTSCVATKSHRFAMCRRMKSATKDLKVDDRETFSTAQRGTTYSHIIKSTSLIGGSQAVCFLIGMLRNKVAALLLGPSGVGLVSLYESILGMVGSVTGLGVGSSAVREVAIAYGANDPIREATVVTILKRICWFTGLLGLGAMFGAAPWLSRVTFGNADHTVALRVLALTLLLQSLSNGQLTVLRGRRRLQDMARLQIYVAVTGLIASAVIFGLLKNDGIPTYLITIAIISLFFSCRVARRLQIPIAIVDFHTTWKRGIQMVKLGVAFVTGAICSFMIQWITKKWILEVLDMDAAGLYHAAWTLSGVFTGFVLSAMGMDFYPRLAAVARDNLEVNRLVNEQTEIGLLLSIPGIVAMSSFSCWILPALYSDSFAGAATLLPWLSLGLLGKVISWPLGFIQLAKGAARWFILTEVVTALLHMSLLCYGLRNLGLLGVALAFPVLYIVYTAGMLWVAQRLSGFRRSRSVMTLCAAGGLLAVASLGISMMSATLTRLALGIVITSVAALLCACGLLQRLGAGHSLSICLNRFALVRWFVKTIRTDYSE